MAKIAAGVYPITDRNLVLSLDDEVLSNSDRGLLGIAADPQFAYAHGVPPMLTVGAMTCGAQMFLDFQSFAGSICIAGLSTVQCMRSGDVA